MFTFQPGDKLVAITGQLAIQPNPSDPVPTDFEDQVRLALKNLENCTLLTSNINAEPRRRCMIRSRPD
jgi:enamine deaminase RidA (YjgF/YER057c/UK114 family)